MTDISIEELDKLMIGGLSCTSEERHDCLIQAEFRVTTPCSPDTEGETFWCRGRYVLHLMLDNVGQQGCFYCGILPMPRGHWNVQPI